VDNNPYEPPQVTSAFSVEPPSPLARGEGQYEDRPHFLLVIAGWICLALAVSVLAAPMLAIIADQLNL
jgi:hypothetical protein